MDINIAIAIISLSFTIVFGLIGLRLTIKYRKKVDLTFYNNECFSLFHTVVKNLPEIELMFQGKPITENIVLLKATFVNTGNIDLDKSNVYKPLAVILPENYLIVHGKIIEKSKDLYVKEKVEHNKIVFEWDLLQNNEYFTFHCLIEYIPAKVPISEKIKDETEDNQKNSVKGLINKLKFDYRISNLRNINESESPKVAADKEFVSLYFIVVGFCLAFICAFSVYDEYTQNYEMKYKVNYKNIEIITQIKPSDLDHVEIKNDKGELIDKVAIDELNKNYQPELIIIQKRRHSVGVDIMTGFIAIASFVVGFSFVPDYIKNRRIDKLLKNQLFNNKRNQ